MKSPIALLLGLLDASRRLNPDVKGHDRDSQTIMKRFENEGYGFLTIALPALDDALLLGLSSGKFTCPPNFKTVRGGTIPRFLSGMFCEVFEPFSGVLKESLDEGVLKSLHGILRLFKKVQLSSDREDYLDEKACTEFFLCDEVAGQVILPDREQHLIGLVSKFILNDLSSRSFDTMNFKHGPGAVEEGFKSNQKWSALSDAVRNAAFDIWAYGYADHSVSLLELSNRTVMSNSNPIFTSSNGASRCTAKLISVAKNSTSRRTITIEPLLNQFIQQGLNQTLRDSVEKCEILSNCLALTDQSKNQTLALEGSIHDNWATIDLKSASDLLSVKLVEAVFSKAGLTTFLDHMMDCRSTKVRHGKTVYSLGKFAGMGNALTFPVQSICFAVLCIAAIHDSDGQRPTRKSVEQASRHIQVFGDDIIVDTRYAHQCVDWLHNVGLKVNIKKSFLGGNFKESCGVEAYKGVDITPLYIRFQPDQISTSPGLIANFVSLSNQAWLRGEYELATLLKNEVEERLGKSLPLVSQDSGVLGWHSRQDSMTPTRWCRKTQQFLTRSFALKPLKRRDRLDGYAALLKFFHVPLLGRARDHLEYSQMRFHNRIVSRWVPTGVSRLRINLEHIV